MRKILLNIISLCFSLIIISCDRGDADNVNLSVNVDKSIVKVGETVNFSIAHNAECLTVYSGEDGHEFRYSLDYLLRGKSEEDINNGNFDKVENPESYKYDFSMNNLEAGDSVNDVALYSNTGVKQTKNFATLPIVCSIKPDETTGDNILSMQNVLGKSIMNYYVRFYPKIPFAGNKTLKFRMRGTSNNVQVKENGLYKSYPADDTHYIYFYFRLNCVLKDGSVSNIAWADAPNGLSNTNMLCKYTPSTEYQDVEFDLTNHIRNWCSNNGIDEKDVDYISYIEFNTKEQGSMVYSDELYISDISFGGISYIDYNTGSSLPITSCTGVYNYSYKFESPGTYEVTFVASNYSFRQDYSSLGHTDKNDYNSDMKYITIPIKVIE